MREDVTVNSQSQSMVQVSKILTKNGVEHWYASAIITRRLLTGMDKIVPDARRQVFDALRPCGIHLEFGQTNKVAHIKMVDDWAAIVGFSFRVRPADQRGSMAAK